MRRAGSQRSAVFGCKHADGAPRDRSSTRREARGRRSYGAEAPRERLIASNARSGPIPLRWAYWWLRGIGPSLAGRLGVEEALALKRQGKVDRPQSSLRTDPAPLGYFLECGPTLAEEALGVGAFALCARDFGVRFQGSLRTDPARRVALSYHGLGLRGAMDGIVWTAGAGERRSLHAW
jgi:hypothetical protein